MGCNFGQRIRDLDALVPRIAGPREGPAAAVKKGWVQLHGMSKRWVHKMVPASAVPTGIGADIAIDAVEEQLTNRRVQRRFRFWLDRPRLIGDRRAHHEVAIPLDLSVQAAG